MSKKCIDVAYKKKCTFNENFLPSLFPFFCLPDVLYVTIDVIWRQGNSFVTMTDRRAIIGGLLVEVFQGFRQSKGKCQGICTQPPASFHYHPYYQPIDMTDVTLGKCGLWLGTRTGASGTATLG